MATISRMVGSAVDAPISHQCCLGMIPRVGTQDGLRPKGQTSRFSLETTVSPHKEILNFSYHSYAVYPTSVLLGLHLFSFFTETKSY